MFSRNFYYRVKYQINKKAIFDVFYQYFANRLKHPFNKNQKKKLKRLHQKYLETKRTSTDYFSINAYYWDLIINKNFKEFSYLEIGSWEGNSASYILKNFKTKKVFCVDVWDTNNDSPKEEERSRFESFIFNLKEFKERFSFFKGTSDEFFKNNEQLFDVIYIDGWHEAPQVYKDINNSWDSLNVNGIIICDDYFYGDIKDTHNKNLPANAINKFLLEKENKLKVICVNNTQIFLMKISS
jgi:predicted O-methyltransferase YrrM